MHEDSPAPLHVPDHEMVRRIGAGSYGEVWLARNVVGTWRAVKVVRRARFDSNRPYEREFVGIQKFEPISRSHPSQVDILHFGRNELEGYFYYVMELADDAGATSPVTGSPGTRHGSLDPDTYQPHTLQQDAEQHRRFPVQECIEIGISLTEALEHLHANGLVHRDVKPSNIVFIEGRPKLADIGLVTDVDATRTYVGTEGFLPPEGPGTPQADVYALGKVLYEISTGKDRRDFPQAPADLDALPDRKQFLELSEVIERACDPNPQHRYLTAREMCDDLALIRKGASVRQNNVRRQQLAIVRRYAGVIAGVAAIFVLGALGATWLHWREMRTQDAAKAVTAERATKNTDALKDYRVGRFWLGKRSAEGFSNALAHFERALLLDPKFPHAHAARAECFNLLASYHLGPAAELSLKARDSALTALRLNANVMEAHLALGLYQRSYEWNWAGAEESFRRALDLDPGSATAHQWYSSLLSALGRTDEALQHARRAVELDPSSLAINANLGQRLYLARRYHESITQYRKVIAMDPTFVIAHQELSRVYGQTELLYESVEARLEALRRTLDPATHREMTEELFKHGTVNFWKKYAALLATLDPPKPAALAEARLRSGDTEGALQALAAAVSVRDPEMLYLNVEPLYDSLRSSPQFVELCQTLQLDSSRRPAPALESLTRSLSAADLAAGITIDEKGGGFHPLFDGKTLNGWRSDLTNWVVQDGTIYRTAPGGSLRYEAESVPDNFELRFEWKTCPGGEGGLNYRPGAVEYQIIDHSNRLSITRPDRQPAALVACIAGKSSAVRPVGQWNEGRVICRGTQIEHWLNGRRVFRVDYVDPRFAAAFAQLDALEKRSFTRSAGNVRARGGHLQLLEQGTEIWFRRLRWRRIE